MNFPNTNTWLNRDQNQENYSQNYFLSRQQPSNQISFQPYTHQNNQRNLFASQVKQRQPASFSNGQVGWQQISPIPYQDGLQDASPYNKLKPPSLSKRIFSNSPKKLHNFNPKQIFLPQREELNLMNNPTNVPLNNQLHSRNSIDFFNDEMPLREKIILEDTIRRYANEKFIYSSPSKAEKYQYLKPSPLKEEDVRFERKAPLRIREENQNLRLLQQERSPEPELFLDRKPSSGFVQRNQIQLTPQPRTESQISEQSQQKQQENRNIFNHEFDQNHHEEDDFFDAIPSTYRQPVTQNSQNAEKAQPENKNISLINSEPLQKNEPAQLAKTPAPQPATDNQHAHINPKRALQFSIFLILLWLTNLIYEIVQ